MMSKAEAYVFYASFHASDAREDGIDEKHELFRKRYFERAYPKAMKALAEDISTPEFCEFYERPDGGLPCLDSSITRTLASI